MLFLSPPDTVQVQLFTDESHHVHYAAATTPGAIADTARVEFVPDRGQPSPWSCWGHSVNMTTFYVDLAGSWWRCVVNVSGRPVGWFERDATDGKPGHGQEVQDGR